MISRMLKTLPLVTLAAFLPVVASAEDQDIKVIGVSGTASRRVTIAVTGDAELARWASKAIGAHGAFELSSGASTKITVTNAGPNKVTATLSTGGSWTATGSSNLDALWRALDAVIVEAGKRYQVKPLFASTKLAFIRDISTTASEVYAGDLMLTSAKPVTGHGKRTQSPHWTPSGDAVYYTSWFASGGADVYRATLSGHVTRIAGYKGTNTGGAVSPDGSRIALALSLSGTSDIYVAGADGSGKRAVAATSDVEMSPCWSPDGSRIAYTGGVSGRPQIMVVPVAGGGARRVSTGGYSSEAAWNPVKPQQIAFTLGDHAGIGVADSNAGGVNAVKLKTPAPVSHPTWCADGRHVVVAVGKDRNFKLGLLDTESGKLTVISGTMGSCFDPDALVTK